MNIIKDYITVFKRYGTNKSFPIDSIEIHTIGTAQNTAESVRSSMNQSNPGGIVNSIVAADTVGKVIEILPDKNVTWADGGYGNNHSITVEICESDYMKYKPNSASYDITDNARFIADITRGYNNAVEYVALKCKEYGFDPEEKLSNGLYRVYSHQEAHELGLASNHVDPTHIWPKIGKSMSTFRKEVKEKIGLSSTNVKGVKISDSNVEAISKVVYGEAGVIRSYDALIAVAQCMKDMLDNGNFGNTITEVMEKNFSAYGTKETTDEARQAVYDVFVTGKKRFENAKIYQFRSFKNYSDGSGNLDKTKAADVLSKYEYLGKDARNNEWGHFYFGVFEGKTEQNSTMYYVQTGAFTSLKNAEIQKAALEAAGFDAIIKS